MKELYLMRHGQTLFNTLNKIQGWCDSPLTELGKSQARLAGEMLHAIPFDHYYCSTAERSSDTLELVAPGVSYTRLKGLKERYFSVFEGESESLNPAMADYDAVFTKYGGESGEDVARRMVTTLTEIMEKPDHQCVLAVSHAGACMTFLGRWINPEQVLQDRRFSNCAVLHFTYDHGNFTFVEMLSIDGVKEHE